MTDPDDLVARLRRADTATHIQAIALAQEAAAEIERLRELLGRMCIYFAECEGTDYLDYSEDLPRDPFSDTITDAEAREIVRYRNAARAKMVGER